MSKTKKRWIFVILLAILLIGSSIAFNNCTKDLEKEEPAITTDSTTIIIEDNIVF